MSARATQSPAPVVLPASHRAAGIVKAALGQHVATRAVTALELYVDSEDGSDNNDGLTADTPLETLATAHLAAPYWGSAPGIEVNINFAGTGGFGANATAQLAYPAGTLMLPHSSEAERQLWHYRGPAMVRATPTTGSNSGTISALSNWWWPIGDSGRTGTTSVAEPATGGSITDWLHCGTVISLGSPGLTANDLSTRWLRITRGGRKVIFEYPIDVVGTSSVRLNATTLPDGTKLSALLQVGDTWEIVVPGARLFDPGGRRINIEGHGGTQGVPGDYLGTPASRGGGGCWVERLEMTHTFMAGGCYGLSADRCDFNSTGDENYHGGTGLFINCLHTSIGILLHNYWSSLHDSANCRPDVASDGVTADPIYQDVDAFSCWGVLRNGCRLFIGSDTSGTPGSLVLERPLSIYGATAGAALLLTWGSKLLHVGNQRSRNVVIQGYGNVKGVDVAGGSHAVVDSTRCRLVGDGEAGSSFDDCALGTGTTKTWDEFVAGAGINEPNNWLNTTYNLSRLTAYQT